MKTLIAMIIGFCSFLPTFTQAMTADLSFIPIKNDTVVGYHIYCTDMSPELTKISGTTLRNPIADIDGRVHYELINLKDGHQYLFNIAPIDTNDIESRMSLTLKFATKTTASTMPIDILTQVDLFHAQIQQTD